MCPAHVIRVFDYHNLGLHESIRLEVDICVEVGKQEVHKWAMILIVTIQLPITVMLIGPMGSGVNTLCLICQIELSVHSVKLSTCAMVHNRQTLARCGHRTGRASGRSSLTSPPAPTSALPLMAGPALPSLPPPQRSPSSLRYALTPITLFWVIAPDHLSSATAPTQLRMLAWPSIGPRNMTELCS